MKVRTSLALFLALVSTQLTACGDDSSDVVISTFDVYDVDHGGTRVDRREIREVSVLVPTKGGYDVFDDVDVTDAQVVVHGVRNVSRYFVAYRNTTSGYLQLVEKTDREFDSVNHHLAREANLAAPGTGVQLSAALVDPWEPNARIELFSTNAYLYRHASARPDTDVTAPADGATSLDGWTLSLAAMTDPYGRAPVLVNEDDDLLVVHSRVFAPNGALPDTNPWQSMSYRTPVATFDAAGTSFVDGVETPIAGTFAAVVRKSVSLDIRTTQFVDALRGSSTESCDVAVWFSAEAEPVHEGEVITGHAGHLFTATRNVNAAVNTPDTVAPADHVQTFEYGNPWGPSRTEFLYLYVTASQWGVDPATAAPDETFDYFDARYTVSAPLARFASGPVAPTIGVPRSLTVSGQPVPFRGPGPSATGVGLTPVIAWERPATGTAAKYLVTIADLTDVPVEGDDPVSQTRIVDIVTTATSVRVPANVLQNGRYYRVRVGAQTAEADLATEIAEVTTGSFTP